LYGADDLHGDELAGTAVEGFDYLSEGALSEEARYTVCTIGQYTYVHEVECPNSHWLANSVSGMTM
jgi:hypothetical protein